MDILNFIFSGFWAFMGSTILISLILRFIHSILREFRYMIIGYPDCSEVDATIMEEKEDDEENRTTTD